MPRLRYGIPGVYISRIPRATRPIRALPTSTAGFAGPAECGPVGSARGPFASAAGLEAVYGSAGRMPAAARAFFANGGRRLFVARIERAAPPAAAFGAALEALAGVEEISLLAAPGSGDHGPETGDAVRRALIAQAEISGDRLALLDPEPHLNAQGIEALRARLPDSPAAALYWPWAMVPDPYGGPTAPEPPAGFVAGLCARTDTERGVWAAPAGLTMPLRGVAGLSHDVTDAELAVLAPRGIDCLREVADYGTLVWGARTLSVDAERRYVPTVRLLLHLEESIRRGLVWAVFAANAPPLWEAVRVSVGSFLASYWRAGAFAGASADASYFVSCGLGVTMTQADIEADRLILQVGVAAERPAEFVVLTIRQRTASSTP